MKYRLLFEGLSTTDMLDKIQALFLECSKKYFAEYYGKYANGQFAKPKFKLMTSLRNMGTYSYASNTIAISKDNFTDEKLLRSTVFHETIHYYDDWLHDNRHRYSKSLADEIAHTGFFIEYANKINAVEGEGFVQRHASMESFGIGEKDIYIIYAIASNDDRIVAFRTSKNPLLSNNVAMLAMMPFFAKRTNVDNVYLYVTKDTKFKALPITTEGMAGKQKYTGVVLKKDNHDFLYDVLIKAERIELPLDTKAPEKKIDVLYLYVFYNADNVYTIISKIDASKSSAMKNKLTIMAHDKKCNDVFMVGSDDYNWEEHLRQYLGKLNYLWGQYNSIKTNMYPNKIVVVEDKVKANALIDLTELHVTKKIVGGILQEKKQPYWIYWFYIPSRSEIRYFWTKEKKYTDALERAVGVFLMDDPDIEAYRWQPDSDAPPYNVSNAQLNLRTGVIRNMPLARNTVGFQKLVMAKDKERLYRLQPAMAESTLTEIHYTDLYSKTFQEFLKKYQEIVKSKDTSNLYVHFSNYRDNTMDKRAFYRRGEIDHDNPIGVYAFPLKYIIDNPSNAQMYGNYKYLLVLKKKPNCRTLILDNIKTFDDAETLIAKCNGENSNDDATEELQYVLDNFDFRSNKTKYAEAFIHWLSEQDNQTQASLLFRAGYDAMEDTGGVKSVIINEYEPEQIVFVRRKFDIVDFYQLRYVDSDEAKYLREPAQKRAKKLGNMLLRGLVDVPEGMKEIVVGGNSMTAYQVFGKSGVMFTIEERYPPNTVTFEPDFATYYYVITFTPYGKKVLEYDLVQKFKPSDTFDFITNAVVAKIKKTYTSLYGEK